MDVLDEELLGFWKKLNENNVMVAGLATRFHGYNRNTDDPDMWLEDDLQSGKISGRHLLSLDMAIFLLLRPCSSFRVGQVFTQPG